ncbi:MAG: GGDEF domain-containing protein, partial [Candidatus Zixiibacteriota bacterium]
IFSEAFARIIENFGFGHFFPVFNRGNLYGIYFIATNIEENDDLLNLLAVTLAFNLSSAYHINVQNQRIGRYEKQIDYLNQRAKNKPVPVEQKTNRLDYSHLLEIRSCRKLIPEMLQILKNDCKLDKLGFYLRNDSKEKDLFSASWNLDLKTDKALQENYDLILSKIDKDDTVTLNNTTNIDKELKEKINYGESASVRLSSVKWIKNKRAVLYIDSSEPDKEITAQLKKFAAEALPLVENINRFEKAEALSYTDGLTGMYNFRYFKKRIKEEMERAKRYQRRLALLIIDIDDLKMVNDNHGHLAGDALIKEFGAILTDSVRVNDIVSRYGGDEFCLLMPDTNREMALIFMDRIISKISNGNNGFDWANKKIRFTVSIGGAVYPDDANSVDGLINSADMALLKAKGEGRNCFRIFNPETKPAE